MQNISVFQYIWVFQLHWLATDIDEAPPWTLSNGQVLPALGVIGGGGVGSRLLVLQEFN